MMFLSQAEVEELTKRIQRDAQARELEAMGIPYKRRRDGSPVVMRACVESVFGVSGAKIKQSEPQLQFT